MSTLELDGIVAGYKGTDVLRGISLTVSTGTCTAIVGPNGAGKSTLLRAISGQLKLREGRRTLDGADVTSLGPHRMARAGVRWIGEPRPVYPSLTVEENLQVGGTLRRRRAAALRDEMFELMPVLAEKRAQRAGGLSGGQQQLLAIGQALMSEPAFLLLDEPSIGLAPQVVETVAELVTRLRADGVGIVWAEQFPDLAIQRSDQVVVLGSGRIALQGIPGAIDRDRLEAAYVGLPASVVDPGD
jgi:branched-chain amino acid transport system ATP-binding protein